MATPNDPHVRRLNTKSITPRGVLRPREKVHTPFKRVARTISADASCETTENKRKLSALCRDQRRQERKTPRIMQHRSVTPDSKLPFSLPRAPPFSTKETEPDPGHSHEDQTDDSEQSRAGDSVLISMLAPEEPDIVRDHDDQELILEDPHPAQTNKKHRVQEPDSGADRPTGTNEHRPKKATVMTPEQVKEMDRAAFPPSIISRKPNYNHPDLQLPTHIKTWGQLKSWNARNQGDPRRIDIGKLHTLQRLHFTQLMAARVDGNEHLNS